MFYFLQKMAFAELEVILSPNHGLVQWLCVEVVI